MQYTVERQWRHPDIHYPRLRKKRPVTVVERVSESQPDAEVFPEIETTRHVSSSNNAEWWISACALGTVFMAPFVYILGGMFICLYELFFVGL